jgi:hypothetical protein
MMVQMRELWPELFSAFSQGNNMGGWLNGRVLLIMCRTGRSMQAGILWRPQKRAVILPLPG